MTEGERCRRRTMRWAARDYGLAGAYFVTICTAGRACRFGDIVRQHLRWTGLGRQADDVWKALPARFPGLRLGAHVVMPNHVHGILTLDPVAPRPPPTIPPPHRRRSADVGWGPVRLHEIVGAYKSMMAVAWARASAGTPAAGTPLWQRGFWDRVLRDACELQRATAYIDANVARWGDDPYAVPAQIGLDGDAPPPAEDATDR